MKKLITLMMLLPALSFAQDVITPKTDISTPLKNEMGVSTGLSPTFFNRYSGTEVWITTRLTYLHNFNNTQIGLILEGGTSDWDYGNLVASVVLNKKFPVGKSYLYAGGNAGFYYADAISQWAFNDVAETGYTLGLQAGLSLHLSNRFSFFSEIGVRSTQVWFENFHRFERTNWWGVDEVEWVRYIDNRFSISLPATMGIRYRF